MDAYRYFFPAGFLFGIWGVLIWILFSWGVVSYPGLRHPDIMMGGFFLCFVCGFLMTAAPKFLSTFGPTAFELRATWSLIALLSFSLLSSERWYFLAVVTSLFVFLAFYLLRRFFVRKSNPPEPFLFVGVGLSTGLIGSVLLIAFEFVDMNASLYRLGRLFFLQTYILSLVMGVGSRLVPALLGHGAIHKEKGEKSKLSLFTFLAVLFILSFVIEALYSFFWGNLLKTLVISFLCFSFWKLYKLPKRKGGQPFWLWASGWFLVLGQWCIVFFPQYKIHFLHVVFVSGIALLTFMIAVRVSLSHGKHDMGLEKNSKAILIGGGLIAFAGLTRLSAGLLPHLYQSHLDYAAYTWLIACLIWGFVYLPKMIKVKSL